MPLELCTSEMSLTAEDSIVSGSDMTATVPNSNLEGINDDGDLESRKEAAEGDTPRETSGEAAAAAVKIDQDWEDLLGNGQLLKKVQKGVTVVLALVTPGYPGH